VSAAARVAAIQIIARKTPVVADPRPSNLPQMFGANVFSLDQMRARLPESAFKALRSCMEHGQELDPALADQVANAMKEWAVERGASHFTHWFQPMTGSTAEKHDSFATTEGGKLIMEFSGKALIKGEPDASSFPSGGLRATFEARGYTAWDPTSPAFIRETANGATVCIPTAFCSWTGEALDEKTPLLRSAEALNREAVRMLRLLGDARVSFVYPTLGCEQEYFLIDRDFYLLRPDLVATGRTLFGAKPPRGRSSRTITSARSRRACSRSCRSPSSSCGSSVCRSRRVTTRSRRVSTSSRRSSSARPSPSTTTCSAWRSSSRSPNATASNACCTRSHTRASMAPASTTTGRWRRTRREPARARQVARAEHAVRGHARRDHARDRSARGSAASHDRARGQRPSPRRQRSSARDHVDLPRQATDRRGRDVDRRHEDRERKRETMRLGVNVLPPLPRDATDRNRTSPFAFTGNKFEFRAVGSSQAPSKPNTVLNTIVADSLAYMVTEIEKLKAQKGLEAAVNEVVVDLFKKHQRILFDGNGYASEWHAEAARRGLPNVRNAVDAIGNLSSKKNLDLFERFAVLSPRKSNRA
jgi:glutamine synthetase